MRETLVLLHGFAGTRRSWDAVVDRLDRERYRPLALDLRGHGDARAARPVDLGSCIADVLAAAPKRFALCGYSLGGRVALHLVLAHPSRVARLVLVATTAGIETQVERAQRTAADGELADWMQDRSAAEFAERWTSQPLFAGTAASARARWQADLLRNDPSSLAVALRALSPGRLPAVWDRLGEIAAPTTIVVGERDATYRALGERMAAAIAGAELVVVSEAGHGLPREAPAAVAAALDRR